MAIRLKRKMSQEARNRISLAQRARWKKWRQEKQRGLISPRKLKREIQKQKTEPLHVVVVANNPLTRSVRQDGDWACFTGLDLNQLIDQGIQAMNKWAVKGYGPYRLWSGVLLNEVQFTYKTKKVAL